MQLLPIYFRHKNFSSFVRQLNFYAFRKRQQDGKYTRLQHPFFKRGQKALLSNIKRKTTHDTTQSVKFAISALTSQVKDLKTQYDDLFKIQQQILYIFSRYMRANPPATEGRLPRVIAGGRERLMLSGAHLSPISTDDGDVSPHPLHPHPNVEVIEDGAEDDEGVTIQELKAGESDDAFDADDDDGLLDLHDAADESKEQKEATAQAFAELQSLQDMIASLPAKQQFLSSIPPLPLPTRPPRSNTAGSARSAGNAAAVAPVVTTPPTPPPAASAPVPAADDNGYVFEPPSPSVTRPTYNAFAEVNANSALPPLYPSAPILPSLSSTPIPQRRAPANPKLLYSQEHYARMERSDDSHSDDPTDSPRLAPPVNGQRRVAQRTDAHSSPSYVPPSPPFPPDSPGFYPPTSPIALPAHSPYYSAPSAAAPPAAGSAAAYPSSYFSPLLTPGGGNGWMGSGSMGDDFPGDMGGYGGAEGWGVGGGGGGGSGDGMGMLGNLRQDSTEGLVEQSRQEEAVSSFPQFQ